MQTTDRDTYYRSPDTAGAPRPSTPPLAAPPRPEAHPRPGCRAAGGPQHPVDGVDGVLGAAVVASGLLAGLVLDWAAGVMPALTAADDRTLVDAMQQTVDNPFFPLTFLVAGGLVVAALVRARRSGPPEIAGWITAGLVLYVVAVLVTLGIHVPLNEDIKNAGAPDSIQGLAQVRDDFADPWVAWNVVRALATTAAFGCVAWALVLRGRRG